MAKAIFRLSPIEAPALFDVHVNIGMTDSEGLSFGRQSGDHYLQLMETSNTAYACAFPPLLGDYYAANGALQQWATHNPAARGRILPFARLGGKSGPRPIREMWQARQSIRSQLLPRKEEPVDLSGYAGVKLIPHMSGLPEAETFEQIAQLGVPVLVHGGIHSPPQWIVETILPKMRTPLIIAHLGTFPGDASLLNSALDLALRYELIYLDTSGAWMANFITHAANRAPHKLLFGSDAPMMHPSTAWNHLASAIRDDLLLEQIGYTNAASLFARWIEQHAFERPLDLKKIGSEDSR